MSLPGTSNQPTPLRVLRFAEFVARARRGSRRLAQRHVSVPGAPATRIVLATDIHAREDWMPADSVRSLVSIINAVGGVDVVLYVGDFVGDDPTAIEWAAPILAEVAAPAYATLGNHDHWTDGELIANSLAQWGVRMLTNDSVRIDSGLWLAGIDSCWGGNPDPERALRAVPPDEPAVVLGHEPYLATLHDRLLHVAGHTHHGQVRFPGAESYYYPKFSEPYPAGFYARGHSSFVHTTAGVGYTTVPFRVNCPPEIVVIDLHP